MDRDRNMRMDIKTGFTRTPSFAFRPGGFICPESLVNDYSARIRHEMFEAQKNPAHRPVEEIIIHGITVCVPGP